MTPPTINPPEAAAAKINPEGIPTPPKIIPPEAASFTERRFKAAQCRRRRLSRTRRRSWGTALARSPLSRYLEESGARSPPRHNAEEGHEANGYDDEEEEDWKLLQEEGEEEEAPPRSPLPMPDLADHQDDLH